MFGIFKNRRIEPPVNDEMRLWLENALLWLVHTFGEDIIQNKRILTPSNEDFPIKYDGSKNAAEAILKIIASQMDVDANNIELNVYSEGVNEISTGGPMGNRIFMASVEDEKYSAGKYWGKQEDNKYHIGLEYRKLKNPEEMIATFAHEIAHIKLLGENRIDENNEPLTDLVTIVFGLGIFNANGAFQFSTDFEKKSWSKLGYLSQMEWGYALALFAYLRKEKNPYWIKFLTTNIKADFKLSERYISTNEKQIFVKPKTH